MEPGFIPCPADDCSEGYRFRPFRVCEVCGGEGFLRMIGEMREVTVPKVPKRKKSNEIIKEIMESEEQAA